MTHHVLEVTDLAVRYGVLDALHGVSLTARGGEITVVTGPNGAGKSSLLNAAYGAAPRRAGTVHVDGIDVSTLPSRARARLGIALVPQGRHIFPNMSVIDNLRIMADLVGAGAERIERELDRFPILRSRGNQPAGVLSGGEQQMLTVARALLADVRVLLGDEMITGLAPVIVDQLMRLVADLAATGVAVVLAEPSIEPILSFVSSGCVLLRGSVAARADSAVALAQQYEDALQRGRETSPPTAVNASTTHS
jgi:branched-chain amino acid transport system ATP-binding protein